MIDAKKKIMDLPYGDFTLLATVDANNWERTSKSLLSRFPDMKKNDGKMTLSVSGNKDRLLAAANDGMYGVTDLVIYNNYSDREKIISTTQRSIVGNYPLAAN